MHANGLRSDSLVPLSDTPVHFRREVCRPLLKTRGCPEPVHGSRACEQSEVSYVSRFLPVKGILLVYPGYYCLPAVPA